MASLRERLTGSKKTVKRSRLGLELETRSKDPQRLAMEYVKEIAKDKAVASPLFNLRKEVREEIKNTLHTWKLEIMAEIFAQLDTKKILLKETATLKEIKHELTPQKGIDYRDGYDGVTPDIEEIVFKVISLIPPQETLTQEQVCILANQEIGRFLLGKKDPTEEDIKQIAESVQKRFVPEEHAETIARAFEKLEGKDKLDYYALKNLPTIPSSPVLGGVIHRGGGTTTGGFSIISVSGTIDDSNVDFVAASLPTLVVINGTSYRNGKGVTISGLTITTDNPVGEKGDIYAL